MGLICSPFVLLAILSRPDFEHFVSSLKYSL